MGGAKKDLTYSSKLNSHPRFGDTDLQTRTLLSSPDLDAPPEAFRFLPGCNWHPESVFTERGVTKTLRDQVPIIKNRIGFKFVRSPRLPLGLISDRQSRHQLLLQTDLRVICVRPRPHVAAGRSL